MNVKLLIFLLLLPLTAHTEWLEVSKRESILGDIPLTIRLLVDAKQKDKAQTIIDKAFKKARTLSSLLNTSKKTDLQKILRASSGQTVGVHPEVISFLSEAQKGVQLYPRFASGVANLLIDSETNKVTLRKGTLVFLEEWNRAYIVDNLILFFQEHRAQNGLVNLGGFIRTLGQNVDGPWKVGVQDPQGTRGQKVCHLRLENKAIVTIGLHRTGPHLKIPYQKQWTSLSVTANTSLEAAIAATAGFVLGPENLNFSNSGDSGALAVERSGKVRTIGPVTAACLEG